MNATALLDDLVSAALGTNASSEAALDEACGAHPATNAQPRALRAQRVQALRVEAETMLSVDDAPSDPDLYAEYVRQVVDDAAISCGLSQDRSRPVALLEDVEPRHDALASTMSGAAADAGYADGRQVARSERAIARAMRLRARRDPAIESDVLRTMITANAVMIIVRFCTIRGIDLQSLDDEDLLRLAQDAVESDSAG